MAKHWGCEDVRRIFGAVVVVVVMRGGWRGRHAVICQDNPWYLAVREMREHPGHSSQVTFTDKNDRKYVHFVLLLISLGEYTVPWLICQGTLSQNCVTESHIHNAYNVNTKQRLAVSGYSGVPDPAPLIWWSRVPTLTTFVHLGQGTRIKSSGLDGHRCHIPPQQLGQALYTYEYPHQTRGVSRW